MKRNLIILTLIIAGITGLQNKVQAQEEGIRFFKGTWAEAQKKAKKEKKPIFLDISASWCGPCKLLRRNTFPNKDVADFYNKHFINVEVDGEVGEGRELMQKFGVTGYPTLIYLDKDGKVVQQTAGYRDPVDFLGLGKHMF
jgi:thioredoxin 1